MVKHCALALLLLPALALALGATPSITGPVTDLGGLLSTEDADAITEGLIRLRRDTGAQMAVLLVDSTGGEPIEDYSLRVAELWGGGTKKHDDGLLLVIAVGDRRMRLEVGYGLEEYLPDDAVRTLLDEQGPLMRQEDYRGAVLGILEGVHASLPGLEGAPAYTPPWKAKQVGTALIWMLFTGLVAGVLLGLGLGSFKEHTGWLGSGGTAALMFLAPMPFIAFAVRNSQLPTSHFLLAQAVFTAVFCLGVLAWENMSWRVGIALIAGTLFGSGGELNSPDSRDVLALLLDAGRSSGALSVALFIAMFFKSSGFFGTTYSSSSSSSSGGGGSGTSWSGGGGSFGGGGASSSW